MTAGHVVPHCSADVEMHSAAHLMDKYHSLG